MNKRTHKASSNNLLYFAAVSATLSCPFFANAQSVGLECNLSGAADAHLPGCPVNTMGGTLTADHRIKASTSTSDYWGLNAGVTQSVVPIDASAYGTNCIYVDFVPTPGKSGVFVPMATAFEWNQFLSHLPAEAATHNCVYPTNEYGSATNYNFAPPFSCYAADFPAPNVFGRSNESNFPSSPLPGPALSCHGGGTSMQSLYHWNAGVMGSATIAQGWNADFTYSPDLTLSVSPALVNKADSITITWNIEPSGSLSCAVSSSPAAPASWGPDGAGNPRSGSTTMPIYAGTTFQLSCSKSAYGYTLTSQASASMSVTTCIHGSNDPACNNPIDGGDGGGGGYSGDGG